MKKILSLLVLVVTFASCEEDVKFNNPAVQGFKNDELWRAAQFTATRGGDNSLTITATNGFEILTLRTSSLNPGTYTLGVNELSKASFVVNEIELAYQTGTGLGEGEIVIDPDNTDITRGYISGNFYFTAYDDEDAPVNFRDGVFYKVPLTVAQ
jgi:hypothetical protein